MSRYEQFGKRLFDLFIVVIFAPLWVSVVLILAAINWAVLGRPIFFREHRAGLNQAGFHILKLRTMTNARDNQGNFLPDDLRTVSYGRFLRASSLDEVPELWNVVRGEMSLVGPRPLPVRYLPRYSPLQLRRQEVRPGVTGLAQVNGRNATTWDERLRLDVIYRDQISFSLDLKILMKTVVKVLRREGITQFGKPMGEFKGEPTGD